jgi:dihydrofolate reductase
VESETEPRVSIIVAATDADVIGVGNDLPWHLPADLKRFKRLTMGHPVIVGRRTQESIVSRLGRPLPGRPTVVLTSAPTVPGGPPHVPTAHEALRTAFALAPAGEVFVIGGAQVYAALLPSTDRIQLTRVHADIPGDTLLPPGWLDGFVLTASEEGPSTEDPPYTWLTYERS